MTAASRGILSVLALIVLLAPLALGWLPQSADPANLESQISGFKSSLPASIVVATAAAILATSLGGLFAAALVFVKVPARSLWATLLLIPLVSPATVWTLAQIACYGRGGMVERCLGDGWRPRLVATDPQQYIATVLVLAQVHAPLAMLVIGRGCDRLKFAGLEAARLYFQRVRRVRWMLASLRYEVVASFLLVFAMSLGNFAVPHVMQCRLYVIDVYMRSANYLDQLGAMRDALPLVALAVTATCAFALLNRGRGAGPASDQGPQTRDWLVAIALGMYVLVTIAFPIAALARDCQSFDNFLAAVRVATPETLNTLTIAGGAALAACVSAALVAPWCVRGNRIVAELAAMLPLGLPTLVIGLAYARTFHRALPSGLAMIADTSLLVVLGLAARGLPFAFRLFTSTARRQAPEWHDAAHLAGLNVWQRWRWITGPLWFNSAATAAIVVFVLSAGDVEVSHLLTVPGSGTLAMRLFTFLHFGPAHVTASLALWQLVVVLTPVLVYLLITDRWLQVV